MGVVYLAFKQTTPCTMRRIFAIIALVLFIGAPLAEAKNNGNVPGDGRSVSTVPPGDILD